MKIKFLIISVLLNLTGGATAFGETIKVGFEPFPPLIVNENSGYTVMMLKEIEKISDLVFDITIMPYNRAKQSLKNKEIDVMGHTPHGMETKEFYQYAVDLDWKIKAITDIFGIKKENIDIETFKKLKKIGTPRGNQKFYSEIFEIPLSSFYDGSLENLLRMLKASRIDAFIFERASTMSTLKQLKIDGVFYNTIDDSISASIAVRNDSEGIALKNKIDASIRTIDCQKIFGDYMEYINLPKNGIVNVVD